MITTSAVSHQCGATLICGIGYPSSYSNRDISRFQKKVERGITDQEILAKGRGTFFITLNEYQNVLVGTVLIDLGYKIVSESYNMNSGNNIFFYVKTVTDFLEESDNRPGCDNNRTGRLLKDLRNRQPRATM